MSHSRTLEARRRLIPATSSFACDALLSWCLSTTPTTRRRLLVAGPAVTSGPFFRRRADRRLTTPRAVHKALRKQRFPSVGSKKTLRRVLGANHYDRLR